jgi:hypothetical protein
MQNLNAQQINKLSSLFLLYVKLYLILGNLPRIIGFSSKNNIAVSEIILYSFTLVFVIIYRKYLSSFLTKYFYIYMVFSFSFLIGVFLNGLLLSPFLYNIRFLLILLSASTAGALLFKKNKFDVKKSLDYFLSIYIWCSVFSLLIFIAFPDSIQLWTALRSLGISFSGDPHQNRLISVYFDPNFFAAIAVLPITIALNLFVYTSRLRYLLVFIFMTALVLLSFSRSGILTLGLVLMATIAIYCTPYNKGSRIRLPIRLKNFILLALFIFIICSFVILLILADNKSLTDDFLERVISRFSNISNDASALSRLKSFYLGLNLITKSPFLGIGYDYLSVYTQEFRNLSSLDSSLQATLINFGFVFTTFFAFIILSWFLKTLKGLKLLHKNRFPLKFYIQYSFYLFVAIFITSQFNNLLYYQFWLFPVVMLGTYFSKLSIAIRNER